MGTIDLNKDLEIECYPLPRIDDFFTVLQKGERFSKIDLRIFICSLNLTLNPKNCVQSLPIRVYFLIKIAIWNKCFFEEN